MLTVVGGSYGFAPINTVAPVVTGTTTVGSTLTTTNGTWTGVPTPTFTYQWYRSPSTSIGGATSSTYVLVTGDVGFGIFCRVKATNSVAPSGVTADSNTTASVIGVPGAPTIGTATATGSTTATVSYTAPASNGGSVILYYTATSSPGGITGTLSTAGSGTVTVSGLSPITSYTFTVTATNAVGTGPASAASNSITTPAAYYMAIITGGTYVEDTQYPSTLVVTSDNYVMIGGNVFAATSYNYSQGLLSISPSFTLSQAKNYYAATSGKGLLFWGMAYQTSSNKLIVKATDNANDAGGASAFRTLTFSAASSLTVSSYSGARITKTSLGSAQYYSQNGVAIDSSGGVYGAGSVDVSGPCCTTLPAPSIVKKDSSGNADWGRVVSAAGTNPYNLSAVALDETNSYAWYSGSSSGNGFVWRASTSTGAMNANIGRNFTNVSNITNATGITLDSSQNVYLAYYRNNGAGPLIKIDSTVAVQWQRTLNDSASSGDVKWFSVKYSTFDGYIYASGQLYSGNYPASLVTAKFNASGTIQWQRRIILTAGPYAFVDPMASSSNLDIDADGNLYVTGDIRHSSTGKRGTFVAKLPADGSLTATGIVVGVNTYTYEASTCSVSTTTTSTTSNNTNALVTMTNGSTFSDTLSTGNTGQSISSTLI